MCHANVVGSLIYVMVCTRPDIAHVVELVSRYMENMGKLHWEAVKYVLRYTRGTPHHELVFDGRNRDFGLVWFCDSDCVKDGDHRKLNSGYVFTLGWTSISLWAELLMIVVLSTTETELIAGVKAAKKTLYLKRLMYVWFSYMMGYRWVVTVKVQLT